MARTSSGTRLAWAPAAAVVAAAAVVVGFPALLVGVRIIRGVVRDGGPPLFPSPEMVGRTAMAVLPITGLALLLAWPAAWASRRMPGRVFVLLLSPMLLPSYLAYAGWGLLRAPGTWLGDLILRGPPGAVTAGGAAANWYPILAGRVQAVLGLTLWVWPLAAVVMAIAVRRVDEEVLESMRLDRAPQWRRGVEVLKMVWVGAAAAGAVVVVVMLGSAVPLHVAQFDTLAIGLWRQLDETPHREHWRIWAGFWPLAIIAVVGAVAVWAAARRAEDGDGQAGGGRWRVTGAGVAAGVVWGLSVIAPFGLLLVSMARGGGIRSLEMFVRANWPGMVASGVDAAWVAGLAGAMAVAVWIGMGGMGGRGGRGWSRRWTVLAGAVFLGAGLMPGILVGSALAHAWAGPGDWARVVGDSRAVVVIGHLARFGFIACLGGWALARSVPQPEQDLRTMDAGGVRGWVEAALWSRLGLVAGVALAAGILSFHEIEAAVMLQPPSSAGGGFAWKVLQALHFNREDDLIAAMVLVVGAGLAAGAVIVALWPGRGRGGA